MKWTQLTPLSPLLVPLLPLQRAAEASTSRRLRTCSALVVHRTASTTARAHGAVTARTATTERCRTPRPWPAHVSAPNHAKRADRANSTNTPSPPNALLCRGCCDEQTPGYSAVPVRRFSLFLFLPLTHQSARRHRWRRLSQPVSRCCCLSWFHWQCLTCGSDSGASAEGSKKGNGRIDK